MAARTAPLAPHLPHSRANGAEAAGSKGVLTFWIPRPPDNANARGHSRQMNRTKKKYWDELNRRLWTHYWMPNDSEDREPFAHARIEATYHHINRNWMLDTDNAMRRLKPVADWLVGHRFLAGDTPDQLEWTIPQQVIGVQDVPLLCSVLITLSELRSAGG